MALIAPLPAAGLGPYLVQDLNTITAGSDIRFLGSAANGAIFTADDGVHGRELWAYVATVSDDGLTGTGTAILLADVMPGAAGSHPSRVAELGGILYFTAIDEEHGRELWRTDGTVAGTLLVRDIRPGDKGSNPWLARVVSGVAYFSADDGIHGRELWRSDGSRAGTRLIGDLRPGRDGSWPTSLVATAGGLFFTADDGAHGEELWKLEPGDDSGADSVALVEDINPGTYGSSPSNLTASGGLLFLSARTRTDGLGLWRSDGTEPGTYRVGGRPDVYWVGLSDFFDVDGTLYFTAGDGEHGYELWRSDGTAEGTGIFQDVYTGGESSNPDNFLVLNGELLFTASDPVRGQQLRSTGAAAADSLAITGFSGGAGARGPVVRLGDQALFWSSRRGRGSLWITDGTAAGTRFVRSIGGGGVSEMYWRAELGGSLYFFPVHPTRGRELWRTDGTHEGTYLVKEIVPGNNRDWDLPGRPWVLGDALLLVADDGLHGAELWRSDGTARGTRLEADLNLLAAGSDPQPLVAVEDSVYFTAEATEGAAVWRSQGSGPDTVRILDGREIREAVALGDRILLAGHELFVSDGTEVGTTYLRARDGPQALSPTGLTVSGDVAYFGARSHASGRELWRTDGTRDGTYIVRDIRPGAWGSMAHSAPLAVAGEVVFFVADDEQHGPELWRSDGTAAGTSMVRDIHPSSGCCFGSYRGPEDLTAVGDTLYFVADDYEHGLELWRSDGSEAGTVMVQDIDPGIYGSYPRSLTAVGETLFFAAEGGPSGGALWRTDPAAASATQVRDIYPGYAPPDLLAWPYLDDFTPLGDRLYFTANDLVHGHELWTSDGTTDGTRMVSDILPGPSWSRPRELTVAGGVLFFSAVGPGDKGRELWRSDGTEAGTWEVADIQPGEGGSSPEGFSAAGDLVFFSADDGLYGRELWAVPASARACLANELLTLEHRAVTTAETYQTCGTVRVGPDLRIRAGGLLDLEAVGAIELLDGVSITGGGQLLAKTPADLGE